MNRWTNSSYLSMLRPMLNLLTYSNAELLGRRRCRYLCARENLEHKRFTSLRVRGRKCTHTPILFVLKALIIDSSVCWFRKSNNPILNYSIFRLYNVYSNNWKTSLRLLTAAFSARRLNERMRDCLIQDIRLGTEQSKSKLKSRNEWAYTSHSTFVLQIQTLLQ